MPNRADQSGTVTIGEPRIRRGRLQTVGHLGRDEFTPPVPSTRR